MYLDVIQHFLTIYKIVLIFRPVVRTCHKRHTGDTNTDQKAKLEGDYYNLFLETAPPVGRSEHLHLTKDKNKLSIGIQKVKT